MADEHPKVAGVGVNSVPVDARCYSEISAEDQRRELEAGRVGRWASEVKPPLDPGEVPRLPSTSPFAHPDGFGVDAPVDINPADPSGTERNRGVI